VNYEEQKEDSHTIVRTKAKEYSWRVYELHTAQHFAPLSASLCENYTTNWVNIGPTSSATTARNIGAAAVSSYNVTGVIIHQLSLVGNFEGFVRIVNTILIMSTW